MNFSTFLHVAAFSFVLDMFRDRSARMNVPFIGRAPSSPIAGPTGKGLVEGLFDGGLLGGLTGGAQ